MARAFVKKEKHVKKIESKNNGDNDSKYFREDYELGMDN